MFGFISDSLTDLWQGAEDVATDAWRSVEDAASSSWQTSEDLLGDYAVPVATAIGAYVGGPVGAGIGTSAGSALAGDDLTTSVSNGIAVGATGAVTSGVTNLFGGSTVADSNGGSFWDSLDLGDAAGGIVGSAIDGWTQAEFGVNPQDLTGSLTSVYDNKVEVTDLFSEDSMRLLIEQLVADNDALAGKAGGASASAGRQAVNDELLAKMPSLNKTVAGTGLYKDTTQGLLTNQVATDARTAGDAQAAKTDLEYSKLIADNNDLIARLSSAVVGRTAVGDSEVNLSNSYTERR